jgi:aminopeptidase N
MERDTLLTTRAMRQPVRSMDSLLQSADALAYQKGSAILHMVEDWIGPDSFRSGVLAYLKEHADGNAVAGDLWSAFRKASGKNVEPSLASFLDQPGVPLVSVEPLPGGRVRLSQSRFVNAGAKPSGGQLWQIPVALRYPGDGGTTTQRVALTKASQVVTLKSKTTPLWIYPNAGESGYYRWSLAGASFEHLAAVAPSTLDVRERVGSLGNSEALLHAGRLAGAAYVKVLESFASDPDPQVALSVLGGLGTIRETFFAGSRDAEFAPYVRRTLTPMLERFGAEKRAGEAEPVTSLRPRLLATLGDAGRDEAVLAQMERLAAAYLADPSSVDPSLADTAIGLSAIRGDAALFDLYRARFEAARVPAERRRFLSALGNFRDPALSARALDYVFTGPLRPQEMLAIPRTQAAVPEAQARTLAWITSHYDQLAAKIPAEFMVFMPHFANGCSIAEVDTAKRFFTDPAHAPPGTSKELARVEESVGDCVSLDAREGASVRRYTTAGR